MEGISINESKDEIIKSLVDMQEQQAMALTQLSTVIDAMRENIVTNMRFELHDAMMECITRGCVTPTEYDRIREKMHNYRNLNGNHGLCELYEERFKTLPIR